MLPTGTAVTTMLSTSQFSTAAIRVTEREQTACSEG
jgi:hypothetical protein